MMMGLRVDAKTEYTRLVSDVFRVIHIQHQRPFNLKRETIDALERRVIAIALLTHSADDQRMRELPFLIERIRMCRPVDRYLGVIDGVLKGLESRAKAFNEGCPTEPDRVLSIGLIRFPDCMKPLFDLVNKSPHLFAKRQIRAMGSLIARHVHLLHSLELQMLRERPDRATFAIKLARKTQIAQH